MAHTAISPTEPPTPHREVRTTVVGCQSTAHQRRTQMKLQSKAAAVCIAVIAAAALAVAVTRAAASRTNPSPANGELAGSPSTIRPGSPGWNQLDPGMQNVILNRRVPSVDAPTIGPGSPGWNQLDPGMQNVILNWRGS